MAVYRYIPQEILNDDFSALDKANVFMLGASLYELATGTQLPTGASSKHARYQQLLSLCGDRMQILRKPCRSPRTGVCICTLASLQVG